MGSLRIFRLASRASVSALYSARLGAQVLFSIIFRKQNSCHGRRIPPVERHLLFAHLAEFSRGAERGEAGAADIPRETAAHVKAERGTVAVIAGEGEGADAAEEVGVFH